MNRLVRTLSLITLSATLAAGAHAQSTERTRAEVIAELKQAVESGEQQAMALQMEGVGHVKAPVTLKHERTLFAKSGAAKKASNAQAQ